MKTTGQCETCGGPLAPEALSGLCPSCLFGLGQTRPPSGKPASPQGEDISVPQRYFGDYELLEQIARGGMGVVFRARQISLNRLVALKMILDGPLSSDSFIARFRTEAEAVAKLHHPNIVPIYETGEHQGRHFFSMKLVEGGTLEQRLRDGPPSTLASLRKAVGVLVPVCRAVHHAHQHGVLHRDIKPGNILFDNEGTPFVADFGLARLVESDSGLTQTGALLGTPAYMAPEQSTDAQVTTATDIYGVGAILYHLLTGRPPFQGASVVETLKLVAEKEAVSPRSFNAVVGRDLETICLKCLAKDPAARYISARALAQDLESWRKNEPIQARPASGAEKLWRWCVRRPMVAALAGGLLLLAIAMVVVCAAAFVRIDRARKTAESAQRKEIQELAETYLAQARALRWSGRSGRRFEALTAIAKAAAIRPSLELRNEAIASMALDDLYPMTNGPRTANSKEKLIIDWPRNRYAISAVDGAVSIRRLNDGAEIYRLPAAGDGVRNLDSFSPNGRWLPVCYNDGQVRCWDTQKAAVAFAERETDAEFGPDNKTIAELDKDGRLFVRDIDEAAPRRKLDMPVPIKAVWWSPDGTMLACIANEDVVIRSVRDGAVTARFHLPSYVFCAAWHPDGRLVAVGCADQCIYPLDPRTGKRLEPLTGSLGAVTGLAFHPGGRLLVSDGWSGGVRLWDYSSGRQILSVDGGPEGITFAPDGARLAVYSYGQSHVELFQVGGGQAVIDLALPGQTYSAGAGVSLLFGDDDRWLITRMDDALTAWDPRSGEPLARAESQRFGPLKLIEKGRRAIGCADAGLCRLTFVEDNQQNQFRFDPFHPVAPSLLSAQCPPGFLEAAGRDPSIGYVDVSRDGQRMGLAVRERCYLFDLSKDVLQAVTERQSWMKFVALSPNGAFVATGGWHNPNVLVWNGATGRLIRELSTESSPNVLFSPSGEWLVTSTGHEFRFWHTGDWSLGMVIPRKQNGDLPSPMCFSADGKMLALVDPPGIVHLVSASSGETLAQIEPQPGNEILALEFNADASQLAISRKGAPVQVWNLDYVRRQLAGLGLDWSNRTATAVGN
ncbi:MAG TPA: serine/threonine-protein kinase [Verrucomicrobiae bacterium]|nr:serine/threonine-protein kinase [Verrucomicrobiae bacterium]